MSAHTDIFESHIVETGEEVYCPIEDGAAPDIDDCVEASTAGRYAGNLNVAERFTR